MESGEYSTNTLAVANISSIVFRVLHITTDTRRNANGSPQTFEKLARDAGHIVIWENRRRWAWHFRPVYTDEQTDKLPIELPTEPLDIPGYQVNLLKVASYEPAALARARPPTTPVGPGGPLQQQQQQAQQSQQLQQSQQSQPATPEAREIRGEPTVLPGMTVGDVHLLFVSALQVAFVSLLATKLDGLPLNDRTLLLPIDRSTIYETKANGAAAATVYVSLTSFGVLKVSVAVRIQDGLRLLDKALENDRTISETPILMAPLGHHARYCTSHQTGTRDSSQPPNTPVFRPTDAKAQKRRLMMGKMMLSRGVPQHIIDNGPWVDVQMVANESLDPKGRSRGAFIVQWPMKLCVRRRVVCHKSRSTLCPDRDVLLEARRWLLGSEEREEIIAKKKAERDAIANAKAEEKKQELREMHRQTQLLMKQTSMSIAELQASQQAAREAAAAQRLLKGQRNGITSAASTVSSGSVARPPSNMYLTPPDGINNTLVGGSSMMFGDDLSSSPAVTTILTSHETSHEAADHWPPSASSNSSLFDPNGLSDGDTMLVGLGAGDILDEDLPMGLETSPPVHGHLPQVRENLVESPQPADMSKMIMPPPMSRGIKREPGAAPLFVKPELRHARSLGDNLHQTVAHGRVRAVSMSQNNRMKRGASPFGPDIVYKRLRAIVPQTALPIHPAKVRKGSVFNKVSFDQTLPVAQGKYAKGGIFSVSSPPSKRSVSDTAAPALTDYLKYHGKVRRQTKGKMGPGSVIGGVLQRQRLARMGSVQSLETTTRTSDPSLTRISGEDEEILSDADDDSEVSDTEGGTGQDEISSPFKWEEGSTRSPPVQEPEEPEPVSAAEAPGLHKRSPAHWLMSKYLAEPEPLPFMAQLSNTALVGVAQVLAQQTATGLLDIPADSMDGHGHLTTCEARRLASVLGRKVVAALVEVFPTSLREPEHLTLRALANTTDLTYHHQALQANASMSAMQQQRAIRPGAREPEKQPAIFTIMPGHLEMRRADTKMSVLPPAITFWESVGLSPLHGPKKVTAMCVFPDVEGMEDDAAWFLDNMTIAYESMKLGTFEKFSGEPGIDEGLVRVKTEMRPEIKDRNGIFVGPYPYISPSMAEKTSAIVDALEAYGETQKNIVLFFVYWPMYPVSITEACYAFYQISELYKGMTTANELVLQLVPIQTISTSVLATGENTRDLNTLCLETYDRCTTFTSSLPVPSILLDEPVQRSNLEFKLSAPTESILHENSSMHVAYAKSLDNRWIAVSWTDSRGFQQQTLTYCMRRKGSRGPGLTWAEVAGSIWQNTIEMISIWKVRWRVVITKCGAMDQVEADYWVQLAQMERTAQLYVVLLAVDSAPGMQLLPKKTQLQPKITPVVPNAGATTTTNTGPTNGGARTSGVLRGPRNSGQSSTMLPPGNRHLPATPQPAGSPGGNSNQTIVPPNAPKVVRVPVESDDGSMVTDGETLYRLAIEPVPGQLTSEPVRTASSPATQGGPLTPTPTPVPGTPPISSNATTPNGEATGDPDGDAVLIDVAEQTWGIVLCHRLNNSAQPARHNLALASGYLIRRGGMRQEDAPVALEVNLVWMDGSGRGVEMQLREMLKQLRGLVTLARVRGTTEVGDCRPWHIAAAEKSVQVLYALL